jgi:hypothetical protein
MHARFAADTFSPRVRLLQSCKSSDPTPTTASSSAPIHSQRIGTGWIAYAALIVMPQVQLSVCA